MELTNVKISARVGNLNSEMFDYDEVYNNYKFDFSGQNIDGVISSQIEFRVLQYLNIKEKID